MESLNHPLSNMQLELLRLFSRDIEDNDVKEIKKLILAYWAGKLVNIANQVWEEKNWTDDDMDKLLQTHMRTPTKDQKR